VKYEIRQLENPAWIISEFYSVGGQPSSFAATGSYFTVNVFLLKLTIQYTVFINSLLTVLSFIVLRILLNYLHSVCHINV
jgi:hypothetical protein